MTPKYKVGDWVIEDHEDMDIPCKFYIYDRSGTHYFYEIHDERGITLNKFTIERFDPETRLLTPLEKLL